jgi:hypothetical protein
MGPGRVLDNAAVLVHVSLREKAGQRDDGTER